MSYTVTLLPRTGRDLASLPPGDYARVRDALRALAADPRPPGCVKLTTREGWRIRVGEYRVIYEIADGQRVVTVLRIRHRRDAYR